MWRQLGVRRHDAALVACGARKVSNESSRAPRGDYSGARPPHSRESLKNQLHHDRTGAAG